jgi:hypothetical protein
MHAGFCWENLREADHLEGLKQILKKNYEKVWTGFIWLKIGRSGKLV